jgi:hypothetical protein
VSSAEAEAALRVPSAPEHLAERFAGCVRHMHSGEPPTVASYARQTCDPRWGSVLHRTESLDAPLEVSPWRGSAWGAHGIETISQNRFRGNLMLYFDRCSDQLEQKEEESRGRRWGVSFQLSVLSWSV